MQETMKRVAAGALGLLMAGSTLLAPGLATADLSSFASMKASDTVIVVGANAITQDVVGAINLGGALAQHGATATVTSTSTVAGAVAGGVSLATSTTPLYMYDKINSARQTIAKGDLSVLDSGTVQDDSGVDYKYDQYLELGSVSGVTYSRPTELADPVLNVNITSGQQSTANALYTSKVVFNNPINVSDTTKAFGGNTIKLFGKDYTIGSTSTNTKLILFGSGDAATLQEGDETTVTVGGTSYTVKLLGVSSTTELVIKVNTDSRTVTKGNSYNIQGLDVYVNDAFYFSKQGAVSSAKLSFGSSRITLENGQTVKTGTSDTAIDGTNVTITGSGEIATIAVAVAAKESSKAYIKDGDALTDPVYGSFKVAFSGVNPSLSDATRDTISFGTAGNDRVTVAVTDYNGKSKTLEFAQDPTANTDGDTLNFRDGNTYTYNVVEGTGVTQYNYILADAGDFSHLFQVSSFSSIGASGAKVTLKDVFSDTNYEITLNANTYTAGSKVIDGQTYYANVTGGNTLQLTWGTGATYGSAGDQTTVFSGLKLKRGEYMYLTAANQAVTLANNTAKTIRLPAGAALGTAGDISAVYSDAPDTFNVTVGSTLYSGATEYAVLVGRQYYNISIDTINAATEAISISLATGSTGAKVTQPAVMVMEEKDDNSQYNTIVVQADDNSDGARVVPTPAISGANSGAIGSTSDASVNRYVDLFGTLVTTDNDGQGKATISYPDSQVIAGVYALETAASVPSVGTVSSGTAAVTQTSLAGGISKVDSAVTSADKNEKNLILVGGPAANALVAELAAANKTYDLDTWRAGNLTGKYVIQAVENAFATGKTAIVVAGYDYPQTQAASLKLATEALTGAKVEGA